MLAATRDAPMTMGKLTMCVYGASARGQAHYTRNTKTLANILATKGFVRVIGKGNKERLTPVGEKALDCIRAYLDKRSQATRSGISKSEPLFLNNKGGRLSTRSIGRLLEKAVRQLGLLVPISPHGLRHTFATHMVECGADIRAVQELLGHESLTTTAGYTHMNIDRLMEVYDKAHPRR